MSKEQIKVRIAEVTVTAAGRKKNIKVNIDGTDVLIPIDETVFAYFHEQFLRDNPTPLQRKRFATIMNVIREAYLKGVADGQTGE